MKRGDILKLSKEGLNLLDGGDEGKRLMLASRRFEYRCVKRKNKDALTVKRLYGGQSYVGFHRKFLELVRNTEQ